MALTDDYDVDAFAAVCAAVPDRRVELLYGSIHVMNRPAVSHQRLLGQLFLWFSEHLPPDWEPLIEVEVTGVVDGQAHRVVPDLVVVRRHSEEVASVAFADVRLAVEVLSPSTRDRDLGMKSVLYAQAGIESYVVVDPDAHTVSQQLADAASAMWPAELSFDDLS